MAKGIFLVNPELNNDDVTLFGSSELGQRGGAPVPLASNSGKLSVTTIGNAGDNQDHSFQIFGTQQRPYYSPLEVGTNAVQFTNPRLFDTMPVSIATGQSNSQVALATCQDRLFAMVAMGVSLNAYVWTGATWQFLATIPLVDFTGGISATVIEEDIYVAVGNNVDEQIELYDYNRTSSSFSQLADSWVATTGTTIDSIAVSTNGALFVLLVEVAADIHSWFGGVGLMEERAETINDTFGATWITGDNMARPSITYNDRYQFIALVNCGAALAKQKVMTSTNGDKWIEFKGVGGTIQQPKNVVTPGGAVNTAIAVENNRVYLFTNGSNSTGSGIILQWFKQETGFGWSDLDHSGDVDGALPVDTATLLSATNWRGYIYLAWRSTSGGNIVIRKGNQLTTTNTTNYREIEFGKPMFVAGQDDDTGTALFFVATGTITAGERWTIPSTEFDYPVQHVLDDFLQKVWRGTTGVSQTIDFDAGVNRAFSLDSIAIFRSNCSACALIMDDDPTFSSPSVTQAISAVVQTATLTAAGPGYVTFAADTFETQVYSPGKAKFYAKFASGTIYSILGNSGDRLYVDGDATGMSGSVIIYRDTMGYLFTSMQGPFRYLRIATAAESPPEGFLTISRVLFGCRFEPPIDYRVEWKETREAASARTALKNGAYFNTRLNLWQRPAFDLQFIHEIDKIRPVINFFGRTQGSVKLFAFWPEPSALSGDQPVVHPMFFTQDPPELDNVSSNVFELSVGIEGQI